MTENVAVLNIPNFGNEYCTNRADIMGHKRCASSTGLVVTAIGDPTQEQIPDAARPAVWSH